MTVAFPIARALRPGRTSSRRVAFAFLPFLVAVSGLAGCSPEAEVAVEVPVPRVMVAPVEAHDLVDRISATGQLLAKARATVAAQVEGQIARIVLDEGSSVEADEVLLEIDPARKQLELKDADAQLAEARAQLREDRRERDRLRTLRKSGAVSQSQLDEKETRYRLSSSRFAAAQARLGLAERALADAHVEAPFAGLVARRHVSVGEYVSPGKELVELVALDPIEVEFHLPEVDSGRVKLGDPVRVQVAPYPQENFEALVTVIAPTIDAKTRTLRVKGQISNPDGRLRPGLFARVDLGVSERPGVPMVPEESVLQRTDGSVVFRLASGGRVERRSVRLGLQRDQKIEIRSGLEVGDMVVVRGHAELIDGALVFVRNADGTGNARFPDPVPSGDAAVNDADRAEVPAAAHVAAPRGGAS